MTLHTLASTGERVDDVVVVHMLPVTGLDRRHQSAVTDSLGRERKPHHSQPVGLVNIAQWANRWQKLEILNSPGK